MKKLNATEQARMALIATATTFKVYYQAGAFMPITECLFQSEGKPALALAKARKKHAEIMQSVGPGKRPAIYALLPDGGSEFVSSEYIMPRRQKGGI